jgi:hypothetical protein
MLMIVVVVIIAAVVAGYAGGLAGNPTKKVPSIMLDVKVVNTGFWYSESGFFATVSSISRPIPTKELKIVTSWSVVNKTTGELEPGGSTVVPSVTNINHNVCVGGGGSGGGWILYPNDGKPSTAPFGTGTGVRGLNEGNTVPGYYRSEQFGEYTLEPGTGMSATANHCQCKCVLSSVGYCPNNYGPPDDCGISTAAAYGGGGHQYIYPDPSIIDPATAVLGQGWNDLRAGDTVNVKVIHLPTNAILFDKNILVTEG